MTKPVFFLGAFDDDAKPIVTGRVRRQDCRQVTDGAFVWGVTSS